MSTLALRGDVLHCLDDPLHDDGASTLEYVADGVLLIEEGHVAALGPFGEVTIPAGVPLVEHTGKLLVPGFVDTHVHYPQVDVVASHGSRLLDWLERYTFPAEARFADPDHARETAAFFLDTLLANGTTTALVFATVHPGSVDAFFGEALARNLRMLSGKVLMDRNAPAALLDTPDSARADSERLIRHWHGRGRLGYAVTPRFAPTSTPEQLAVAGALLDAHPGVHLHTHLAENAEECDWVASLFPDAGDYLGVYERFGLVRRRSVFAHAIHLPHDAWRRLATAGAAVAHCPTSNLFIGSGLYDLRAADAANVATGLGTDVGGGDSFSILRTLNEAYKVQQLQRHTLSPGRMLYLATLGGARALDLGGRIGSFERGKEADLVVLDEAATPLLARRTALARGRGGDGAGAGAGDSARDDWRERLFALMMLGDERCVVETRGDGRGGPHLAAGRSVLEEVAEPDAEAALAVDDLVAAEELSCLDRQHDPQRVADARFVAVGKGDV